MFIVAKLASVFVLLLACGEAPMAPDSGSYDATPDAFVPYSCEWQSDCGGLELCIGTSPEPTCRRQCSDDTECDPGQYCAGAFDRERPVLYGFCKE